jgi:hypothetical protein
MSLKAACATSVIVHLSTEFAMGSYDEHIDFSGKTLVIYGNNAVLDASMKGTFFVGTSEGSSLELHDITMKNGGRPPTDEDEDKGGAIYMYAVECMLVIERCRFENNGISSYGMTLDGGAIYIKGGVRSALRMSRSTFESNQATSNGGAVVINSCGGSHPSCDYGLFAGGAGVEITDCSFIANTAGGAAALVAGSVVLNIRNCCFERNKAKIYLEGAVKFKWSADMTYAPKIFFSLLNCSFRDNEAGNGAALHVWDESENPDHHQGEIRGCTFTNNIARAGGAIFAVAGRLIISTSIFEGNKATENKDRFYDCYIGNPADCGAHHYGGGSIYALGKQIDSDPYSY